MSMAALLLRRLGRLAIWGPLALGPLLAQAGAGVITTVVTPLSDAVTYSVAASATRPALNTFIGYTVTVTNAGRNTINHVRFTGAARATDLDESVVVSSVEGATCTIGADLISVDCYLGKLKSGQSAPTFAVFFKSPVRDAVSPLPNGVATSCTTTDCVAFKGITYYAEGMNGVPQSVPQNSTNIWAAPFVTLGTANPSRVKTAVPSAGASLFTGNGAVSLNTDKFTTAITVPSGPTYTTAEIQETDETATTANCLVNLNNCFRSNITVPGTFAPYLTIVLRQDSSTIRPGTHINNVQIEYTGTTGTVLVGLCASPTTPRTDGLPCIAKRVHYSSPSVPGWTPDLNCDFEWTLISTKNGSYKVF